MNKALTMHSGQQLDTVVLENEDKQLVEYEYWEGKLHGTIKTYNLEKQLTNEATYSEGLPIHLIMYNADNGQKNKELYFNNREFTIEWIEYDKSEKEVNRGTSTYKLRYDGFATELTDLFKNNSDL